MKVIILAAGKGSRLYPLTQKTPKPLIKIFDNKTIIDFILESLPEEITEVYIVLNHLEEKIKEHISLIKNKYKFKIFFTKQKSLDGTMGALNTVKKYINVNENFLVIQGDDIHEKSFLNKIIKLNWAMSISKKIMPKDYLSIETEENYFKKFRNQNETELKNGANIVSGVYILNHKIFNMKDFVNGDGENSLPHVMFSNKDNKPICVLKEEKWLTVNNKQELESVKKELKNENRKNI